MIPTWIWIVFLVSVAAALLTIIADLWWRGTRPRRHWVQPYSGLVVCAWCQSVMHLGDEPASHGICDQCADDWRAERARSD